jgi:TrmH family RNA methyltransferase
MLPKADVQRLRSLSDPKVRRATGCFVVEGPKVIEELLRDNFPFLELYATDAWSPQRGSELSPRRVTAAEMERISHYPTPSPVLAVARIPLQPTHPRLDGWSLALDGIQDPGNVGTLLRIADWFGIQRVLLSAHCADSFSQKAINASMGSFARVEVWRGPLPEALARAGDRPIIGCDLEGVPLPDAVRTPEGILVLGSEGRGLSPEVASVLTRRVTIPRVGRAESLNVAVAAGIVCAHFLSG